MQLTPSKINTFLFFKLPAAYFCGVRVQTISKTKCVTTVKHRWINQNPFRSMYFAVQCMAAELSTGALVMQYIRHSKKNISMLVGQQNGVYSKKAVGRIIFECVDGSLIAETVKRAIDTGEGQEVVLKSTGKNSAGDIVSTMNFHWYIKLKES